MREIDLEKIKRTLLTNGKGAMAEVVRRIHKFYCYEISPVLITGPSGSGKEFVARLLLDWEEKGKQCQAINCAGFTDQLLHSELFGHKKGAYTDAVTDRKGLIRSGTQGLFLDEIDKSSLWFQNAMLRYIRDGEIRPLGSDETEPTKCDARLVFASAETADSLFTQTHKSLIQKLSKAKDREREIEKTRMGEPLNTWLDESQYKEPFERLGPGPPGSKEFSVDFLNRITSSVIDVPSLKDRREDIYLLLRFFIEKYESDLGQKVVGVEGQFLSFILTYSWPLNIAEFENFVRSAVLYLNKGVLTYVSGMQSFGSRTARDTVASSTLRYSYQDSDLVAGYLGLPLIEDERPQTREIFAVEALDLVFENIFALWSVRLPRKGFTGSLENEVVVDPGTENYEFEKVLKYFGLKRVCRTQKEIYTQLGFQHPTPFHTWLKRHHLYHKYPKKR